MNKKKFDLYYDHLVKELSKEQSDLEETVVTYKKYKLAISVLLIFLFALTINSDSAKKSYY